MADHGIGLAEALLGLDGFKILDVTEVVGEVVVRVETVLDEVVCGSCGRRAEAHDRMTVQIRDLPCFGRATRLVWVKRRWRCRHSDCAARTWTEVCEHVSPRQVLTRRCGQEVCRQVGANARPVAQLARELSVEWWTVMNAVIEHGTPLVDDPNRVGAVTKLGLDETSFLAAKRRHRTRYVTGFVDLDRRIMIDVVKGNDANDIRGWIAAQDRQWINGVETVAVDLAESYRAGHPAWITPPGSRPVSWS